MSIERLATPSAAALEEMRRHLEDEHQRDFNSERDVFHQGNPSPDAVLPHRPASMSWAEGYLCSLCPGRIFLLGLEPALDDERIGYLSRNDPGLEKRLSEVTDEDRVELTEAHEEKKKAKALLEQHRRKARLSTASTQPAAQERRDGAQAYLLAKYQEIGNVEETIWSLVDLVRKDPQAYRQVMGTDRVFAYETVRKYWLDIAPHKRQAAKRRFLQLTQTS